MKNVKTRAITSILVDIVVAISLYVFIPYEKEYSVPLYYGLFYFVIAFIVMDLLESLVRLYVYYYGPKKLHTSDQHLFEQAIAAKEIYDESPRIENEVLDDSPLYDDDKMGCYSCVNFQGSSIANQQACFECRHLKSEPVYSSKQSKYSRAELK